MAKCLPESDPLRGVAFDGIFEGEGSWRSRLIRNRDRKVCALFRPGLHETEEDLTQVKPQFGDVQVFYSSVKKTVVEVKRAVFFPGFSFRIIDLFVRMTVSQRHHNPCEFVILDSHLQTQRGVGSLFISYVLKLSKYCRSITTQVVQVVKTLSTHKKYFVTDQL